MASGQAVEIIATNSDGSWYQLGEGRWIAATLVDNPPVGSPIAAVIPEPTPTPKQETANPPVQPAEPQQSSSIKQIGEEVEGDGWKFKVVEVHKRKALYWGSDSKVAFGHYLIVIVDDQNMQTGTDYFARNLVPWIADDPGEEYLDNRIGTLYATWQFGGLGTMYSDLNPGVWGKIVIVFDLPDDVGHILLSTAIPAWVDLGDFSNMAVEE